jgi:hypothetical protein
MPEVLGLTLIVLVIAEHVDGRATGAFERSARRALGSEANIEIQALSADPPDAESVSRAADADGVIELSWPGDGARARVHCYLTREARWVDREIDFGPGTASPERESSERGRLLGYAVATMFTEDKPVTSEPEPVSKPEPPTPLEPDRDRRPSQLSTGARTARRRAVTHNKSVEVAGIASSGINGNAAGLGASAALRFSLLGPVWARLFVAARSGDIPLAQASTRTVLLGSGLTLAALPDDARFELGARLDGFAYYFGASHLSEDDTAPDTRSRWLAGADALAEAGVHLGAGSSLFLGGGIEAVFGRTDIYTHGKRVAVVPPLRAVGEFGFRTRF